MTAVSVREADADELLDVVRILDAAALEVDATAVERAIENGDALVAAADGRILGALVLDGSRVDAVAVRRRRRDRGIGSALVARAADRVDGPLTAEFDRSVRSFYRSLGFEIDCVGEGRFRGTLR